MVFYSYKSDGKPQYETQTFEKHESGLWVRSSEPLKFGEKDKELAAQMNSWLRNGSLEPKPGDGGPTGPGDGINPGR